MLTHWSCMQQALAVISKKQHLLLRDNWMTFSFTIFLCSSIPCIFTFKINHNLSSAICFITNLLGRVVRKPVNVNPGLNVNWGITVSYLKMYFTSNVWCSMRFLQLNTEGQTISTEHQTKKLQNWIKNFR